MKPMDSFQAGQTTSVEFQSNLYFQWKVSSIFKSQHLLIGVRGSILCYISFLFLRYLGVFIRIIFVFAAAYFISSCDKHKWDNTKNMFKPHGHVDSDHDNVHQD